jgi:pimeloyl-ACP methyl ester carboxylesterase
MQAATRILGDGTKLDMAGRGRSLVLIHGVGMDLTMWEPLIACLGDRFQLIRYDMIGHGGSPKPTGPYRLVDFVAQLQRIVGTLDLAEFDLLGFSMGGLVAQGFAATGDARLRRLILLNTVYRRSPAERDAIHQRVAKVRSGGFPASVEAALERWFTPQFRAAYPDQIDAVRRHMLSNDLAAYAAAYEVFATADAELSESAARIGVPTLVMTGSDDQRSTPGMAEALAADLPLGTLALLPAQRHLTPFECPDLLARHILSFLAGVPAKEMSHG